MWSTFDLVRQYLPGATASSLHEAMLAKHEFQREVHVYLPAYSDADFPQILSLADHLSFNSFSQWERFKPQVQAKFSPCIVWHSHQPRIRRSRH